MSDVRERETEAETRSGSCATGKRVYYSERLANRAITKAAERGEVGPLRHYACPDCGWWHLATKFPVSKLPKGDAVSDPRQCEHPDVRYFKDQKGAIACMVCGRLFGRLDAETFTSYNPLPSSAANWRSTWRDDAIVVELADGTRGAGQRKGAVGLAEFMAGTYPACSLHGALVRVGSEPAIWRCLIEGCNVGAITA